jgi:hypothetical protein
MYARITEHRRLIVNIRQSMHRLTLRLHTNKRLHSLRLELLHTLCISLHFQVDLGRGYPLDSDTRLAAHIHTVTCFSLHGCEVELAARHFEGDGL